MKVLAVAGIVPIAYAQDGKVFLTDAHVQEPKCFADKGYEDGLLERMNRMEDAAIRRLRGVLQRARDSLISRVTRARDLPKPREVSLSGMNEFRAGVRDLLQSASALGARDARREVREAKRTARGYMYSPTQHRGAGGRWGDGEETVRVFHGTAQAHVDSIIENGLTIEEAKENRVQGRSGGRSLVYGRGNMVFVTPSKKDAIEYGVQAATQAYYKAPQGERLVGHERYLFGDKRYPIGGEHLVQVAVLEFHVPKSVAAKFQSDKKDNLGKDRTGLQIPGGHLDSKYLKGYTIITRPQNVTSDTDKKDVRVKHVALSEEDAVEMHVALVCVSNKEAEYAEKSPAVFRPRNAMQWMREKEFFVTDLLSSALTSNVRGLLVNALKNGELNSVVADRIWNAFEAYIGDPNVLKNGEPLSPHRLDTIVRTNLTDAYNHGRMMEFTSEEMLPFMTGIRYSAILDDRTTPCCAFLHGKVFSPTDPDLTDLLPPNHFNCRSIVVPVVVGEKIDIDDFITPQEVGTARGLADAKFLTQENA